jgi:hypothetical protein
MRRSRRAIRGTRPALQGKTYAHLQKHCVQKRVRLLRGVVRARALGVGTDAGMVQTVAGGRVWVFAALDHFNSEVIGIRLHRWPLGNGAQPFLPVSAANQWRRLVCGRHSIVGSASGSPFQYSRPFR